MPSAARGELVETMIVDRRLGALVEKPALPGVAVAVARAMDRDPPSITMLSRELREAARGLRQTKAELRELRCNDTEQTTHLRDPRTTERRALVHFKYGAPSALGRLFRI